MKSARQHRAGTELVSDVCLIVEGCYPYVAGGVSTWLDWLMRSQPDLTFSVVSIVADREPRYARYQPPANLRGRVDLVLQEPRGQVGQRTARLPPVLVAHLARLMTKLMCGGGLDEFRRLVEVTKSAGFARDHNAFLESREAMAIIRHAYDTLMPHASFLQFFWAWRTLFGGMFAVLSAELPDARVYHTISTGYAGLVAARAAVETRRPAIVTEHGIYNNERRIDLLLADWLADSIERGVDIDDDRMDVRDVWVQAFETQARICYEACAQVTTLYRDNQALQIELGADPDRMSVIPNGIDLDRFGKLSIASRDARPTIALIGRVVPIKDTKSFIKAASILKRRIGNLHALVLGPTDEDIAYAEECRADVRALGLEDCVTFTGAVAVTDHLPHIHVVVLTSLSEAQPLVLLEAGAAGIPCVATNVGACREIIMGKGTREDPVASGGFVADLVAPEQIADAAFRLLDDHGLRRACGDNLRRRVHRHYAAGASAAAYASLYKTTLERASTHDH